MSGMQMEHNSNLYRFLALAIFQVSGLTSAALADPLVSSKVQTITVRPTTTGEKADAPQKVHSLKVLTVRPRLPDENRDASGREIVPTTNEQVKTGRNNDLHSVSTIAIKADDHHAQPAASSAAPPALNLNQSPDRHVVQTIRVTGQHATYDTLTPPRPPK
jgi:hypothetical protein